MTRPSLRAPLALTALVLVGGWSGRASAQAGPDDEPLPPVMGPPRTAPPPPAPPPGAAPPGAVPSPGPGAVEGPPRARGGGPRAGGARRAALGRNAGRLPPHAVRANGPSYHLSTAEVGPVKHLRLALHGQYFRATNFLVQGADGSPDTNSRLDGIFTFGYTPHQSIEIFGAILTSSNRNQRVSEPGRRNPELIKSFGDLVLGGKGILPVARGFSAGAELGLRFLSSISDLSFSPSSTSFWIGAVASVDPRRRARCRCVFTPTPTSISTTRRTSTTSRTTTIFTREVAMFAYGIQGSRLRFALGVDAPLERLTAPVPLQPFVEYHAEIVADSADPAFSAYPKPDNRDQQWLTFGLRARVYRGLSPRRRRRCRPAVGRLSVRTANRALRRHLRRRPSARPRRVRPPGDRDQDRREVGGPTTGTVAGRVVGSDGKPVADAVVTFVGQTHARVATDPDGGLEAGPCRRARSEISVGASGFETKKTQAVVQAGAAVTVEVSLVSAKPMTGNVRGRVADASGKGMPATLRFAGVATYEAHADASGAFSAALPAGPYKVTIEAPGWPSRDVPIDINAGQDRQLDVTLRGANPDVTLKGGASLRVPISSSREPKLGHHRQGGLDGVAQVLAEHPKNQTLRIEAHWNGPAKVAKA